VLELNSLIAPLLGICQRAGEVICDHYYSAAAADYEAKGDDSPLTRADLDSHQVLAEALAGLLPGVPMLSEESPESDRVGRRNWGDYWLVDPLDGTKEFLARTGEFTINIALIADQRPVLGVLYLPLERAAYVGIPGLLACRYQLGADGEWDRSSLAVRRLQTGRPLTLLASRRHRGPRLQTCLEWLAENWGEVDRLDSGSALKFCQLAEGVGDFYPRYSPCCEWDTGAGQAVLEAAGGCLLGLDGEPLRYNCSESLLSPNFYAIADRSHELWSRLIERGL
jgi:3'(2'), 5'-bisphosphate nucleotidase